MDPLSALAVFVAAVAAFVLAYIHAIRAGRTTFEAVEDAERAALAEVQSVIVTPSSPAPLPAPAPGDKGEPAPLPGPEPDPQAEPETDEGFPTHPRRGYG